MIKPENSLSVTETAFLLGIHPLTVRRWVTAKKLVGYKFQNRTFVDRDSAYQVIEELNGRTKNSII